MFFCHVYDQMSSNIIPDVGGNILDDIWSYT